MCGSGARNGSPPNAIADLQRSLRTLKERLEELESACISVESLKQQIAQMCWCCQMMFLGISSELDRLELQQRIQASIKDLEKGFKETQTESRAA
jgi:DNA repair exonuclease SbcCD ATPase subunit